MSRNDRNCTSSGARSKTFRNESVNTKKKNRNFSESSDDSNWNRPKPLSTYVSSGTWDDVPDYSAPKNNAWNENLTSKWSENRRSNTNTTEPRKQNGEWNGIDTEFPALESRPEPPIVNVWEVRKQKANQKKALEPSNETEEERMLRKAIELSKIEVGRDEEKRRELEEEYYMQKHLLATNPSLYSEFYTDEEVAALFPAREEEKSKYEAKYQNSFSEEEYNNQNLQHKGSSKSNQLESYDNHNAQLPSERSTDSKEKISKAIGMFGGWGNTQGNSQSVNKSKNSAVLQPKGNTTQHRKELVFENQEYKRSKERQRDDDWNTNDPEPSSRSASAKTRSLRKREDDGWETNEPDSSSTCKTNRINKDEEIDKDWAWKTDDSETNRKPDSSKTHSLRKSKDEDYALKTGDADPYNENCLNATDRVWAWKTEDPESVSVSTTSKTHRKCDDKDEDYAWKTDDPKPTSRPEANSYSERETDQDLAWKTEDSELNTYSSRKSEDKDTDDDYAWKSDGPKLVSNSSRKGEDKDTDEDYAWKSDGPKLVSNSSRKGEDKDTDEDYAWKSDDPKLISRLETSSYKEREETDQDGAWKAEDSVPKNVWGNSMKSPLSKTQYSSWETEGDSSLQGLVSKSKKIETLENESWKSNPISSGRVKSRDTNRGIRSKSNDVSSSYKSSLAETNEDLNSQVTDSISNETFSSQYLNNSLVSEEKNSSGRKHNQTASGDLADSIVSDYVNLASSRKEDDQNLNFSNVSEPSSKKSVFELLKKDYGNHFVLDSEEVKPFKDEPKIDTSSFLAPYVPEKNPGLPNESLSIEGAFDTFHNSKKEESLSYIISSNSIQPDDDISLPLFATSYNEADQTNSSKISVSDEFRQSFGAHFQQFQSISTITPVFMMNPYMMAGMSPMGMMPQMGMNPMMQPMGMNPMIAQMGMNPMMAQMGMNPMMQQMSMNTMVQQNPMMAPMGMNPVMQHMSVYKQMVGNNMLPQSNLAGSSLTEGSFDLNPFIPPPTDRSDLNQANGLTDSPQMQLGSASIEAPSTYGKDEWLEQFLSKPVFNEEPSISAPTMPQSNYPSLGSNAVIDSSPIPAPRGTDEFACSPQMRAASAQGNADNMMKSMRNSSRYASEKQTEVRQPASMPSWGRAKQ